MVENCLRISHADAVVHNDSSVPLCLIYPNGLQWKFNTFQHPTVVVVSKTSCMWAFFFNYEETLWR